jgi:DNA polymerase I
MKATRADAVKLFMEGTKALSLVESNGIRVDVDYLKKAEKKVIGKIGDLEEILKKDEIYKLWEKVYGNKMKLGSSKQIGEIFYNYLGFKPMGFTPTEEYRTDKSALEMIDHPFARVYIEWKELQKALAVNIKGLKEEIVDGFIHPFIHLHIAKSGRSTETNPNLQNIPTRNPMIAEIIRRTFIPREGNVIIEGDLNMHEVRISGCYCKDRELIRYCNDPDSDMHRDQARNLFLLSEEEVSKEIRFYAKNQFVFASFYGSFYKQCAPLLWQSINRFKLKTTSGKDLGEHLKEKGIKRLGNCDFEREAEKKTFEYLVKQAENKLWEQFHQFAKWKKDWWDQYCKKGYFDYLTGFRAQGVMKRNEVLNLATQGTSFHCLLWILIQMDKWIRKNKMKTKIINEIHDSINFDCPKREVLDVVAKFKYFSEEAIQKEWTWLIVPLKAEIEICEKNWFEKVKFDFDKWRI